MIKGAATANPKRDEKAERLYELIFLNNKDR